MRILRLVLLAMAGCGVAGAQELGAAARHAVLETARSHYYSLTGQGVRSFACRVRFDFGTVSEGLLPPEDQFDRKLLESAAFVLKVGPRGPALRYEFPQGSVSQSQETVAAVTLWVSELVQGFFQTWPTKGFAGPVPGDKQVKAVVQDEQGYRISARVAGAPLEVRMSRESLVTALVGRSGTQTERPHFEPTAQGLVYAGGESVETDRDGRTEARYTIQTGLVAGVLLPRAVRLQVGQHVDVRWEMDGCLVDRK